jgi:acyl carrier protein
MPARGTPRKSITNRTIGRAELGEARSTVIGLIHRIAPDVDLAAIDGCASLHDVAELDSLDFLRLVSLIAETTGVVVPPRDYPQIVTLDGFTRYLAEHRPGTG